MVRRHYANLCQFAKRRGLSEDDAHDIAVRANMKALRKLREGAFKPRGEGSYKSWLTKIAQNMIIDHYRAGRRVEPLELSEDDGDSCFRIMQLGLVTRDTPEEQVLETASEGHVECLLNGVRLTPDELEVMKHTMDGEKPRHIEQLTGIPAAQVSRLLYRARKKFKQTFPTYRELRQWLKMCGLVCESCPFNL